MDQVQATQLRTLLLDAADAINRANALVATLDLEDREALSASLDEISSALHFEVLQKLYLRYPGLAEEAQNGFFIPGPGRHDRK
jgi:transcriptional regulator of aromatic amino acid metabolism